MDFTYSQIDINSYVAKYMDEAGCTFEQACAELDINQTEVFSEESKRSIY